MESRNSRNQGKVLSLDDLQAEIGFSKRSLYKMAQGGQIPAFKVGRSWKIRQESLEKWLEDREAQQLSTPSQQPDHIPKSNNVHIARNLLEVEDVLSRAKNTVEEALSRAKNAIEDIKEPVRKIIDAAASNGVEAIYSPRRSADETSANIAISSLLQRAKGEVHLQGVSLRQFFHDKMFWPLIWRKITQDSGVYFKALLLDPFCDAALARVVAEESTGETGGREYADPKKCQGSQVFMDIQRSISKIIDLQTYLKSHGKPENLIEVRFYNCTPFAFFIITQEGMIIEQYHFGRSEWSIKGECIGELVPLLHIKSRKPGYNVMLNSFSHLWNADKNNQFITIRSLQAVNNDIATFLTGSWPKEPRRQNV